MKSRVVALSIKVAVRTLSPILRLIFILSACSFFALLLGALGA
jgi:hypothetical protein